MEASDTLPKDEVTQSGCPEIGLFHRFENFCLRFETGMIDEDFRIGHRDNVPWFFHRPGMQIWRKDRKFAASRRFWAFLDGSRPEKIESPDSHGL